VLLYYGRQLTLQGLQRCKPNPHYLEKAIADLESERPLYVGDSRSDVAVAARLEIDSAFIRRPHREEYVVEPEPTYEVASFEELHGVLEAGRPEV
jgi:phosphoglycolate phosphatase-like HAD superfamily hydrolase